MNEYIKVHPHRHNHHRRRTLLGPEQAKRTTSATSQRAGSIKAISRPGSGVAAEPQAEGEEEGVVAQKESPPVPETTIFMLAVEFLLEVKGMQVGGGSSLISSSLYILKYVIYSVLN